MELTATEAGGIALDFLTEDLEIPTEDRDWFTILSARPIGESWYVVEIGVEGLPDKWFIQVYDTGEYDPNYTFNSPIRASEGYTDLVELPERIADVLVSERSAETVP